MPRAIWKAFIEFGPVSVPVKLYTAVKDVHPHSHLLHDHDQQRLQQRMVCCQDEATVGPEETVRGYEVSQNEYVVVEPMLAKSGPAPSGVESTYERRSDMTHIMLNRTIVAGLLCAVMIAAGCATTRGRGEAKEATRAVTSMQETRAELVRADQQLNQAMTAMDQLASSPQDLPQAYKVFTAEVSQTDAQAQTARHRAEQMRSQWRQYITAWEKEIDQLSIPELQARAAERRQVVRENYDRLRDAARAMDAAYQPFISHVRDIEKSLSLDLTPAGVQAAQPGFEVARKSAADLKQRIGSFIAQIDAVSANSPTQQVGTAAAR